MAKLEDYQAEAQKVYDGQYASKVQSIKNQQASQNQQYDNDQTAYNNLYDKYVKENRSTGVQNQNAYNNQTLARGLGRSSIANTGLAGIKLATDKQEQAIQSERALKLQQLYNAKALYNQQVNDNLNALESERIGAISEYARKLYEAQMDRELQERLAYISRSGYGSGSDSYSSSQVEDTKNTIGNEIELAIRGGMNLDSTKQMVENAYAKGYINGNQYFNYQHILDSTIKAANKAALDTLQGKSSTGEKTPPVIPITHRNNQKTQAFRV